MCSAACIQQARACSNHADVGGQTCRWRQYDGRVIVHDCTARCQPQQSRAAGGKAPQGSAAPWQASQPAAGFAAAAHLQHV
jgi:hypothetical protein